MSDINEEDLFVRQPVSEALELDKESLLQDLREILEQIGSDDKNPLLHLVEQSVDGIEGGKNDVTAESLEGLIGRRDEIFAIRGDASSSKTGLASLLNRTAPRWVDEERRSRIIPWRRIDPEMFIMKRDKIGDDEVQDTLFRLQYFGISLLRLSARLPDEEILESYFSLLGQVAGVQNDFIGEIKTIRPKAEVDPNTGDSAQDLGFHVDGTQAFDQPALLAFQYVKTADFGGTSRFVDLAGVLKEIPNRDEILVNLARPDAAHFEKKDMAYDGPIFSFPDGHSIAGRLRFDSVMSVNDECKEDFETLRNAIHDGYEISFKPHPGDIIVFDNWRLMHARTEIYGDAQRVHRRVWMNALHMEYQGKYLLGIRPIDAKIEAKMKG
jgi:hypothetical protein